MHLSPVKGGFPFKDQHDHTAPIAMSADDSAESFLKIERGNVICLNDKGEFVLATEDDAGTKPLFLALQRFKDLQAAMAGQFSPANGEKVAFPYKPGSWKRDFKAYNVGPLQGSIRPAITGIHMDDGDVWEDDMFDETVDWEAASINAPLTVADGGLITLNTGDDASKTIGYLVERPTKRYCNDAPAVEDMMTGAYRYVIRFQCGL